MVPAKAEALLSIATPDYMDYCNQAPSLQLAQWHPLPMDMSLHALQPVNYSSINSASLQ